MPNDVCATWGGREISHRSPGPFRVEPIGYGMAIVVNALGVNWLSGFGGGTRFERPEDANAVADAINRAR